MEKIEEFITPEAEFHEDFRLWITCEANPAFPQALL